MPDLNYDFRVQQRATELPRAVISAELQEAADDAAEWGTHQKREKPKADAAAWIEEQNRLHVIRESARRVFAPEMACTCGDDTEPAPSIWSRLWAFLTRPNAF